MSMIICVDGPAHLYLGPASCGNPPSAWIGNDSVELGFTETGVQVSIQNMTHRVNSDDMGGSEGNPAELLFMGAQASIRGVLVKYNPDSVADILTGLFNMTNEGDLILPGTPVFASNHGCSLVIQGFAASYYFPRCEMTSQPREFNISTTERKTSFGFTAYPSLMTSTGDNGYNGPYLFRKNTAGVGSVYAPCVGAGSYGGSKTAS